MCFSFFAMGEPDGRRVIMYYFMGIRVLPASTTA